MSIALVQAAAGLAQETATVNEVCGETGRFACEMAFRWSGSETFALTADWLLDRPIRIVMILIAAWVVVRILRRAVMRFTETIANPPAPKALKQLRRRGPARLLSDADLAKRSAARAETIGLVLRSVVAAAVWSIAALLVLGELDLDIAPLIAGAGIGGIALGFGAQTIVTDFLAGLFMLIEDQYGVGDVIDFGDATGTVEEVSLRTTTVRDIHGTVWHVPNGQITRIANFSQIWARALLDVEVAYDTDLRHAQEVIQSVADTMWDDPEWGGDELMARPEVWGVQDLGASGVSIRLVVQTEPSEQWPVERELRLRIKEAFDEAGIEIPYPTQTVWLRSEPVRD